MPRRCVEALRDHRVRQAQDRLAAGPLWQDHELVFASTSRFRSQPDRGPGTRLRLTSRPDAGEVAVSRDLVDDAHVRELPQRPPGCVRRDPQIPG